MDLSCLYVTVYVLILLSCDAAPATKSAQCEDQLPSSTCQLYDCSQNAGQIMCPKYCGLCSAGSSSSQCEDKLPSSTCELYDCSQNAGQVMCPKSCGACSSGGSAPLHPTTANPAGPQMHMPCSQTACGRPPVQPSMHRVVGGHPAQPDSWPWTVMMLEQGSQVCGGAVISETMVLTAAHCFEGVSHHASRWEILAGRTNINRPVHGEQRVQVRQIIIHPHYDDNDIRNDIALVVLATSLTLTSQHPAVLPLCVPQGSQGVHAGQQCMLGGWGDTMGTGNENVLNEALLPVISDATCSRGDHYGAEFEPATTFCAGYSQGGTDACQGDSGSPLACKVNNQWYIQGISSWGYDCAKPKWPGIYTDVSKFSTWLSQTIAQHSNCGSHVVG